MRLRKFLAPGLFLFVLALLTVYAGPAWASPVNNVKAEIVQGEKIKVTWDFNNAWSYYVQLYDLSISGYPLSGCEVGGQGPYEAYLTPHEGFGRTYTIYVSHRPGPYDNFGDQASISFWYGISSPKNLTLSNLNCNGSAHLSWDCPNHSNLIWFIDIDGHDKYGYTYHRSHQTPGHEGTNMSWYLTDLPPEGLVNISVYSKNGYLKGITEKVGCYVPMKPLSGLTGAYTSSNPPNIELKWEPGTNHRQDAVEIERTNPDGTKTTIINEYYDDWWLDDQDSGHLEANKIYKYRIRAISKSDAGYNSEWSEPIAVSTMKVSAEVFHQVATALLAPTGLQATAKSNVRIDLNWIDVSFSEQGYAIERTNPDGTVTIMTAPQNATSYSDTGLLSGKTYNYRVQAVRLYAYSDYSNTASATTFNLKPTLIR